jgi:hypothetical protein
MLQPHLQSNKLRSLLSVQQPAIDLAECFNGLN